jgi:hypothetical protein
MTSTCTLRGPGLAPRHRSSARPPGRPDWSCARSCRQARLPTPTRSSGPPSATQAEARVWVQLRGRSSCERTRLPPSSSICSSSIAACQFTSSLVGLDTNPVRQLSTARPTIKPRAQGFSVGTTWEQRDSDPSQLESRPAELEMAGCAWSGPCRWGAPVPKPCLIGPDVAGS